MGIVGMFVENGIIPHHWGCSATVSCASAAKSSKGVLSGIFRCLPSFKLNVLKNESFLGIYTLSVAMWYLMSDKKDSEISDKSVRPPSIKGAVGKVSSEEASVGKLIFEGGLKEPPRRGILRKPNRDKYPPKNYSPKPEIKPDRQLQVQPPVNSPGLFLSTESPSSKNLAKEPSYKSTEEATSSTLSLEKSHASSVEEEPYVQIPHYGFCECNDRECEGGSTTDAARTSSAETSIEVLQGFACEPIDRCRHCGLYYTINQNALARQNVLARTEGSLKLAMGDSDVEVISNGPTTKSGSNGNLILEKNKADDRQAKLDNSLSRNNKVKGTSASREAPRTKRDSARLLKGKQGVTFNLDKKSRLNGSNLAK